MIAKAQIAAILTVLDMIAADGLTPERPRVTHIPADVLNAWDEEGVDVSAFGDGTLILVGAASQDMADCECGMPHVDYVTIAANGRATDAVTSGTFAEVLTVPPAAQWDNCPEIDPDEFARML